jgi:hypothetical protein
LTNENMGLCSGNVVCWVAGVDIYLKPRISMVGTIQRKGT